MLTISASAFSQDFKGKDGARNYTLGTAILNRYTSLASPATSGSLTVTVTNINELSGSFSFTNSVNPYANDALAAGDLIMIIQMQGADITTSDDSNYGEIIDYNNTGNYEIRTVYNVSGNTILLCQNLQRSYNQGGRARTQVIRIPRLTTLNIGALAAVTGREWNGVTGGVVAIETSLDMTVNGSLHANAIGYRGGVDDKANSVSSGTDALVLYRTSTNNSAGKGEGIVGFTADYNSLNGAYGRGAAANGGGGGNGHNAGGGGGSLAGTNGALTPWNGTGIKDTTNSTWIAAWNLESANFASNFSVGGGRGGYTFSSSNQNALVLGPGQSAWGGNKRQNVGGFGGRPLDFNNNTRLFMGGGGGAGDGNNSASGNGGNGAGIVYVLSHAGINGVGTISANGQAGYNTIGANIDGAGGGGAGGSVYLNCNGTISNIDVQANGGAGGSQLLLLNEAEGPGGGGSGGYIATTATSVTRSVTGAANGQSISAQLSEFLPNGATRGANGNIVSITFQPAYSCSPEGYILPVKLSGFTAQLEGERALLDWTTDSENNSNRFEVERSFDGQVFSKVAIVLASGNTSSKTRYAYKETLPPSTKIVYYRLKMIDNDGKYKYSETRVIRLDQNTTSLNLASYPNPVRSTLYVTLPGNWQGKNVKFELYDVTGKLSKTIQRTNANQTESIYMQDLVAGFYIVRASMGDLVTQQRVIKN